MGGKSNEELRRKVISSKDGRFKAMVATPEDMEAIAEVFVKGFQPSNADIPILPKMFPRVYTPEGQRNLAERFRAGLDADPTMYHVKVIDTEHGGRIVTQGKWFVREEDNTPITFTGPYWDTEEDRQEAEVEVHIYFENRRKAINTTPGRVYCISAICSLPEVQGQGAGELWIKWGLEEADAEGSLTIVEVAPKAVRFYEKHGFINHGMVDCGAKMPEKWRKEGNNQLYAWMTRQPRPPSSA